MRIIVSKEALNRKILNWNESIWRALKRGAGEEWRMENIERSDKVTNEQVLEYVGEKRTLLSNILRIKAN